MNQYRNDEIVAVLMVFHSYSDPYRISEEQKNPTKRFYSLNRRHSTNVIVHRQLFNIDSTLAAFSNDV